MLVKRPVYNQQLKCVAFEILSDQKMQLNEELANKLRDLINNSDTQLPLLIPFALKDIITQFETPIQNPIILKVPADEIESKYSLQELQESLFSIALLINRPQQLAWLNFAEYIGLSDQLMNGTDVTKVVQYSKAKHRKVIAYGIHQPICFDKCKTMTMDYYCGDFLFKPLENVQTEIAANRINFLKLIQLLQKNDCNLGDIADIIKHDPLLSFQILRLTNSLAFSNVQTIESIDQAIARLGLVNLKNWIMLFAMKNISNKPPQLLESGLIRAFMAEELAKQSKINHQKGYIAGLLSILDGLLNTPMKDLINQITLTDDIKNALLHHSGDLGEILALVIAYEEGHWEQVSQLNINGTDLSKLYIDSLAQVTKNSKSMHG